MKVFVDGKELELNYITAQGINIAKDFIGNYGALTDGQFRRNEDANTYEADADTYAWWSKVIADHVALDERIADLKAAHGDEAIAEIVDAAANVDLEDMAAAINAALDEFEGK